MTSLTPHADRQLDSLKFTDPAVGLGAHSSPRIRTPVLTDALQIEHFGAAAVLHPDRSPLVDEIRLAQLAIEARARTMSWIGAATSDVSPAGTGFIIRYENADIYYSAATGAHEVHGDIRAKYNAFGSAGGILGLPTTDETSTPDNVGRFNHFQGGSIYWTAHTGPMVVRGPIRDRWASEGWERSTFGYPIADFVRRPGTATEFWGGFQNGAIFSKDAIVQDALVVELDPQIIARLVRKTFDTRFKAADDDLGIQGGVNILNVSDWGYGFWESTPRTISYEINGFYSIGYPGVIPDPTFRLALTFQFELLWQKSPFTEPKATDCGPLSAALADLKAQIAKVDHFLVEPAEGEHHPPKPVVNPVWLKLERRIATATSALMACAASNATSALTLSDVDKTVIIYLRDWHLSTAGLMHEKLYDELSRRVPDAFPFVLTTIPAKAMLIDLLVTPQGGLKFLLAPGAAERPPIGLGTGQIRRDIFENDLNSFVESTLG
jgi:LGFP repeat-containing protein